MFRIFVFTLLHLSLQSLAQADSTRFGIVGRNDTLGITAIRTWDYPMKYYLLVPSKSGTDSLMFDDDSNDWWTDTCIISAMQLDRKGKPEIILVHKRHHQAPNGSKNYDMTITQVWNIDTKQNMFKGTNYLSYDGYQFETDSDGVQDIISWSCDYSYNIQFTKSGKIIISNQKSESEGTNDCIPDKSEGTYALEDGVYVLKQKK